jgi:flagellar hook-associated protein 1 FlgK
VSTFSGLNTARTALWAAQRGLDVSGQNIANVNTAGYSRQRVEQQSVGGNTVPAVYSVSDGIGGGVNSDSVIRIRDAFLESRAQTEHATTAQLTVRSETLSQIEQAFREPGETGIQSMLADVWAGWSDVANNPKELGARSQVIESMQTLAAGIRTTSVALDQQRQQTVDSLGTLTQDVNKSLTSIAGLNEAIKQAAQTGLAANELMDKRDALVLALSAQTGATSIPRDFGVVDVVLGGTTLVSGPSAIQVKYDPADPAVLTTSPGGSKLAAGGTAGGLIAALGTLTTYQGELDARAVELAAAFNGAHDDGYDQAGVRGTDLFGFPGGAAKAGNLTLLITDPALIAAAAKGPVQLADVPAAVPTDPPVPGKKLVSSDGGNADAFYRLSLDATGVDAKYRKMIVGLGVEAAVATRDVEVQAVIGNQVDSSRESVSGVSLDEEMTNMMSFQHAYSAAGRMITAIDEALDVLINRTGLVGR